MYKTTCMRPSVRSTSAEFTCPYNAWMTVSSCKRRAGSARLAMRQRECPTLLCVAMDTSLTRHSPEGPAVAMSSLTDPLQLHPLVHPQVFAGMYNCDGSVHDTNDLMRAHRILGSKGHRAMVHEDMPVVLSNAACAAAPAA